MRARDRRVATLAVNHSTLHHKIDVPKMRGISERIARRCHEVGIAPGLDGADAVGSADEIGRIARCGEERFHRRQAASDHETELHCVVAFADIGAVGDLHTGLNRQRKVFLRKQIIGEFLGSGPGSQEFWVIAGRRGGKTRAMSALAVYLAGLVDHKAKLVSGERPAEASIAKLAATTHAANAEPVLIMAMLRR